MYNRWKITLSKIKKKEDILIMEGEGIVREGKE